MGVRGDFKGLENLKARIASLATPEVRSNLVRVVAEEAALQVDKGFREERDPYGKPWKPSGNANGHTLVQKSVLRNSLAPKVTPSGFVIATAVKYAGIHQYGGVIKAKTSKGLVFKVTTGHAIASAPKALDIATGAVSKGKVKRYKKPRAITSWVRKMQVTIPQRQFMPEGNVGPIWGKAIEKVADDFIRKTAEGT